MKRLTAIQKMQILCHYEQAKRKLYAGAAIPSKTQWVVKDPHGYMNGRTKTFNSEQAAIEWMGGNKDLFELVKR